MNTKKPGGPFELELSPTSPLTRAAWERLRPGVEWGIGFSELARLYARTGDASGAERFIANSLRELGVGWSTNEADLARIPRSGACVAVANHPFGGVDGLVLLALLLRIRKDVKLLGNELLGRIPELRDVLLPVDLFGGAEAQRANGVSLREAMRHLKRGGLLAVFPAGEVAHFDAKRGRLTEKPWTPAVAWVARVTRAPVLPIYFAGANSALFHAAGLVHPLLRTLLLPRELLNKRGREIEVQIGGLIQQRSLARFEEDEKRALYLQRRVLMLAARSPRRPLPLPWTPPRVFVPRARHEPVIAPIAPAELERELSELSSSQLLVEDGDHVVACARAAQIPKILREIGRLRELTFREASEGTGKAVDLDEFDDTYLHLFTFDRKERALMGAYRMGLTDRILERGVSALYTSTLFRMDPALFRRIGPAIEMGRSFVCARYQRSASGLFLLWRGIGRFLAQNPRYRFLFGPVSVSAAYAQISREIMVDFVRAGGHMHPLSRYVRQRNAFVRRTRVSLESGLPPAFQQLLDVEELSSIVADIEPDHRGVPVLFKQYFRLGGKILGCNVDPRFSGVLDLLILVDLAHTDPKILGKYLGSESARVFLGHHTTSQREAG